MDKPEFCGVGNFPVLIPYEDLEKLLEVANKLESYEKGLSLANDQLLAMRMQYAELLEKVRELDRMI